jgi:hypothetical protein
MTGSTSTNASALALDDALKRVPVALRKRLLRCYKDLKSAHVQGRSELVGLKAGKFCEVVMRLLQHQLTGAYTPFGTRLQNFAGECDGLARLPKAKGHESLRVLLPRAINFLYTLRNKRDIGHVGGDIDANAIDSAVCARIADWCLCEVMRLLHSVSLEEAQGLLDTLATRQVTSVWEVMGRRRVLAPQMSYRDQVLLLLYDGPAEGTPIEDLFEWTEHSRMTNFVGAVVGPLHKQRLVEYDKTTQMVIISPTGIARVEMSILAAHTGPSESR